MSSLKLLLLEDSKFDAELILRQLKNVEYDFETKVVAQKAEFEKSLVDWVPDIIISDFNLQTFRGDEALALAKKVAPETPFITLSGSITNTMELTLLENRANDVLTKDNLKRLPFAINRVLNEQKDKQKLNSTLYELAGNLKFQEALADILLHFNSTDGFEQKVNHALRILGLAARVSRVYIFEDFDEGRCTKNTFEWCDEKVTPEILNLKNVSYELDMPSFKRLLESEGRIYSNDVNELPLDMQAVLKPQNIKALIVYPIQIGDVFFGFIGFDEVRCKRHWSPSEDKLLKSVSGIFSSAYSEHIAKKNLEDSNKRLSELLEEKEALVGEVHHRVKNNLALISSFLQLEQMGLGNNSSIDELLSANILRIKSIAIVHEIVYQHGSFSKISVLEILQKVLKETFFEASLTKPSIEKVNEKSGASFNINQAVPLSLLFSEIMFQVLSIKGEYEYKPSSKIEISSEEIEGFIYVHLKEASLIKVLSILKKGDKVKFSEIIEVLGRQLNAELIINEKKECASIKFEARNVKGSSSSIS